jgi:hypothetical protein
MEVFRSAFKRKIDPVEKSHPKNPGAFHLANGGALALM